MTTGEKIRDFAKAKGLDTYAVAASAQRRYGQVRRWYSGASDPDIHALARVAERLGLPMEALMGEPVPQAQRAKRRKQAP